MGLIKVAKCLTAQNVLPFANNLIALHIAKHLNQNANQFAKNQNVTGLALNPNVNSFAKTQIVSLRLIAVLVQQELLKSPNHSPSSKNLKVIKDAADAIKKDMDLEPPPKFLKLCVDSV